MSPSRALALALAALLPMICSAQWRWIDKSGRTVFSDQPPPPDVPAGSIVKQPGRSAVTRAAAPPAQPAHAAAALQAASSAVKPSGQDKALLDKKKQADAAAEAQKKAHEQEVARVQAENCRRARLSKGTLDSGARIAGTDEHGQREYLDDEQRAAEMRRVEQVIATECKPG